jgi:predicted transcriptional regulator
MILRQRQERGSMKTLIIGNQPWRETRAAVIGAWKTGKPEAAARFNFESLEAAWELFNVKRWAILKLTAGQGPLSIREIARRTWRDVRAVQGDVRLLYHSGAIDKTDDGKMILPFEVIRLDLTLDTGRVMTAIPSINPTSPDTTTSQSSPPPLRTPQSATGPA